MELGESANAIGRKKFALVQHELRMLRSLILRWRWTSNLRSPMPSVRMQATFWVRSGRLSMNHSRRRLKSRQLVENFRFQGLHGKQRNQSHHGANFHGEIVCHRAA